MTLTVLFVTGIAIALAPATKTEHYVPLAILGQSTCAISTGLLTRINTDTNIVTINSTAPTPLASLGFCTAKQLPYLAVQTALSSASDAIAANALVTLFGQIGAVLGLGTLSTLSLNRLFIHLAADPLTSSSIQVPAVIAAVTAAVIAAGAADLPRLALRRADVLAALRGACADLLDDALVLSVVASWVSVPAAAYMQWLNVRVVADQRAERLHRDGSGDSCAAEESAVSSWKSSSECLSLSEGSCVKKIDGGKADAEEKEK